MLLKEERKQYSVIEFSLYCLLSFSTAILFGLKLNLEFLKPTSQPKANLEAADSFVQTQPPALLGDLGAEPPLTPFGVLLPLGAHSLEHFQALPAPL